jgi:alpha-L-arabinofuranosidase
MSATLSSKGDIVTLFAVNSGPKEAVRPIDLTAFGGEGHEATVWTLTDTQHAGEPDATNNFSRPERIVPLESKFRAAAAKFEYRFPPYSLTVLQWKIRQ